MSGKGKKVVPGAVTARTASEKIEEMINQMDKSDIQRLDVPMRFHRMGYVTGLKRALAILRTLPPKP